MKKLSTLVITLFLGAGLALGQAAASNSSPSQQAAGNSKTTTTGKAKTKKAKSGKKSRKSAKKGKKATAMTASKGQGVAAPVQK